MKLIIIRHGITDWNARHKVQGLSNQPLSRRGAQQARLLGRRFAKENIGVIYTSKLSRAIKTAEAIAKYHPSVRIIKDKRLNEMDWGEWEGLTFGQLEKKYPREFESRKQDKFHFAPRGGESPADLKKRLLPFLKRLITKHRDRTVFIVGHGGINRVLLGLAMGWSDKKIAKISISHNTAVNILNLKEGKSKLHLFNCTRHLEV